MIESSKIKRKLDNAVTKLNSIIEEVRMEYPDAWLYINDYAINVQLVAPEGLYAEEEDSLCSSKEIKHCIIGNY